MGNKLYESCLCVRPYEHPIKKTGFVLDRSKKGIDSVGCTYLSQRGDCCNHASRKNPELRKPRCIWLGETSKIDENLR